MRGTSEAASAGDDSGKPPTFMTGLSPSASAPSLQVVRLYLSPRGNGVFGRFWRSFEIAAALMVNKLFLSDVCDRRGKGASAGMSFRSAAADRKRKGISNDDRESFTILVK